MTLAHLGNPLASATATTLVAATSWHDALDSRRTRRVHRRDFNHASGVQVRAGAGGADLHGTASPAKSSAPTPSGPEETTAHPRSSTCGQPPAG